MPQEPGLGGSGSRLRAAAYIRVLPFEQDQEGFSLPDQSRRIEAHIAERGWEQAGAYADVGIAARPRHQRELHRLMTELEGLDKVVVTRLDRFGPQTVRLAGLLRRLEGAGVDLVSLEEGFDTGAPTGRVVPRLVYDLAAWPFWDWQPDNLHKPGLAPTTIIDVGAADGTSAFYRAFPGAYCVLIEPLVEFEPILERLTDEFGGEHLLAAVGAKQGTATIAVDHRDLLMSSLLSATRSSKRDDEHIEEREVPVTTLDSLLDERGWSPPFGLKLDTEGFEYEVIQGATRLLEDTQFVIAEVSVSERFERSYSFAQFVALMDSRGFRLCDVLSAPKSASHREIVFMDAFFRREP